MNDHPEKVDVEILIGDSIRWRFFFAVSQRKLDTYSYLEMVDCF